jgi:anaerobic selenocysteine-containing dehydrogenase
VTEVPECWPDYKIINELAKKMGYGEYFWEDADEVFDYMLKPAGITFKELRRIHLLNAGMYYKKYEKNGFKTPSGKVELYSSFFEKYGAEPLPVYHEAPETAVSDPELAKDYPLIITSSHNKPFLHSDHRWVSSLRSMEPEPCVDIHPETAQRLGIADGDMVYIENKRGRIKQRARLTDSIDPRVVKAAINWWFPEQGTDTLHGWAESNYNILTDDQPPLNPEIGSSRFRGFLVRVYKTDE